ncbi:ABC transporter substrate-binding protein [Algoriphagus limi]|uniref:ABC transporter substrate-binding protein n=1 Tax=Algoriphagus limi TaxID=2975273 RepID=A0ABT2G9D2_9BACT|nr:ABC transporter substrate-binding protein [Algoriphagus limi]MCS5491883.1 ABC transporter substrate-binding protein [Algoriphagus limi]
MKYLSLSVILFTSFWSCSPKSERIEEDFEKIQLQYAKGFSLQKGDGVWVIDVLQPWTGALESFRYLVVEEGIQSPQIQADAVVHLPAKKVILTSTTHIPHLDLLGETKSLIGFPNLDLISSSTVWEQIEKGEIQDLGSAPSANVEMIIDLQPDWVMISTLGDDLKQVKVLEQAGIPALINGEYVEQHPLGRAEWIKFTGVLFGKYEEAEKVFRSIENSYFSALESVKNLEASSKPTVLSGVLYEDSWFAPGADSWGAQILNQAGGDYVFSDQDGTGSVPLSYEFVIDRAIESEFWIGSADFESLEQMKEQEPRYRIFKAFQEGNVFTYSRKRGPRGGFEYFELGYVRPDLVLKDLIKILHPDLLPGYQLYFYQKLNEK